MDKEQAMLQGIVFDQADEYPTNQQFTPNKTYYQKLLLI